MLGLALESSLKVRPMHSPYKLDGVRSGYNKGLLMVDKSEERSPSASVVSRLKKKVHKQWAVQVGMHQVAEGI